MHRCDADRRGYALTYVDRMRLSHRRPAHRKLECGTDCFACPGRTSLASDQVCRANGCQNFYSLTQAECENFKTLNLGQTCPGGGFKGLSHFVCYDPTGAFKTESGGCDECEHFEDYTWTR